MHCFEKRAVQIDLARQIETMDMVLRYFDTAHEAGMNTVLLYLEDRIKTESYPYSPDEESYSPAQIREMVAYADRLGLELIPVVSPIGHTERFLRHPEMKHLAELRGKIAGAFTAAGVEFYNATCPSLPETLEFFDRYLTEVAQLFPSRFFHIGFDEIWDMGFCEKCRDKPTEELYRNALLHFHDVLKKQGKEIWIWDDMLEQFPWVLEQLPRDIVMCAWFYQYTERYPVARFSTSRSYDLFGEFERLGFRYMACGWFSDSLESLTAYAAKYQPLGMLMTAWEMYDEREIPLLSPVVQYAGLLWNGEHPAGQETLRLATSRFVDTPEAADALAVAITCIMKVAIPLPGEGAAYPLPTQFTYIQRRLLPSVLATLDRATGDADCLDAYRSYLRRLQVQYHLWETGYALHEYRAGEGTLPLEYLRGEATACQKEVEALRTEIMALWERCRPGLAAPQIEKSLDNMAQAAQWLADTAKNATEGDIGRLVVRFDLPEFTAACKTRLTLHYADGTTYEAGYGTYKAQYNRSQKYDYSFEIPASPEPDSVTLTVNGYGASGARYVSATLPGKRHFLPAGITQVSGQVEHPEFLLSDDSRAALLGDQEMLQFFVNETSRNRKHSVTIALRQK